MLTYLFAGLIGLSLGLLGSGGSVLAVPILKYSAGLSAKQAVATSLATVGAVSTVGSLIAWRQQRVAWREAALFSLLATLGTFAGVQVANLLSDQVQMAIFALIMTYALVRMTGSPKLTEADSESPVKAIAKALGVGLLTGVVGVGGGFLIVPALVALFGLTMKRATGTSLVVITVNSLVGALAYSGHIALDWVFTLKFALVAVMGLLVGVGWAQRLSEERLKFWFAALLTLVLLYTIGQEFLF